MAAPASGCDSNQAKLIPNEKHLQSTITATVVRVDYQYKLVHVLEYSAIKDNKAQVYKTCCVKILCVNYRCTFYFSAKLIASCLALIMGHLIFNLTSFIPTG